MRLTPINNLASILLFMQVVMTSCKKTDASAGPTFTPGYNVYIAGDDNGSSVYWKNGAMTNLSTKGMARAIAISGQDVYFAGQITQTNGGQLTSVATVWKNGTQQNLTNGGFATSNGIGLNGVDVYVTGSVVDSPYQRAVYWKNGTLVKLAPKSYGFANDIIFLGSDIYIAGQLDQNNDSAVVWKNGVLQTPYASGNNTWLTKLAFNGADLYAAGSFGGQAAYFKNGILTPLATVNSGTSGIAFKAGDSYIVGAITDSKGNVNAAYWKNGNIKILADKYSYAVASGIAFAGDDIYISGTIYDDLKYKAVYWKNGIQQELSSAGHSYAIAVGQ